MRRLRTFKPRSPMQVPNIDASSMSWSTRFAALQTRRINDAIES
jgi:hypothetical protein